MTIAQEPVDIHQVRDMQFHMDGTHSRTAFDDDIIQGIVDGRITLRGDRTEGQAIPPFITADNGGTLRDLPIYWTDMGFDDEQRDVFILRHDDRGHEQVVHLLVSKNIQESTEVECGPDEPFDLLTNPQGEADGTDPIIASHELDPEKFLRYVDTVFPDPTMTPRLVSTGDMDFASAVGDLSMGQTQYWFIGAWLGARSVDMTIFAVKQVDDGVLNRSDESVTLMDILAEAQWFAYWHQHEPSTNPYDGIAVCCDSTLQCVQAGLMTRSSRSPWVAADAPSLSIAIATDPDVRQPDMGEVDAPIRNGQVLNTIIPLTATRSELHDMMYHIMMTWLNRIEHTGSPDIRSFIYANSSSALTFDIINPSMPRNVVSIRNTAKVGAYTTDAIRHGHQLLILDRYRIWDQGSEADTVIDGHTVTMRPRRTPDGDADLDGAMVPVIDRIPGSHALVLGGTVTGPLIDVRSDEFDGRHPLCHLHGSWQVWFAQGYGDAIMVPADPESTMLYWTGRRFADAVCVHDQVDSRTLDPMRFFGFDAADMKNPAPEAAPKAASEDATEVTQEEHHERQ